MMNQPIGNLSAETQKLDARLKEGSDGQELLPKELEAVCGLSFDGTNSAGHKRFNQRKWVILKEYGLFWRWIKGRGVYRCCLEKEKVEDIGVRTKQIRRAAKRNISIGSSLDFTQLTKEESRNAQVLLGLNSVALCASSTKTVNKLMKATEQIVHMDEEKLACLLQAKPVVIKKD